MGGPSVAMETDCRHLFTQSSAQDSKILIWEDLTNSNMVFNVKKLLNDGVDLTLWQRGKKKQHEQSEWQVLWIQAADGQFFFNANDNLVFETACGPLG